MSADEDHPNRRGLEAHRFIKETGASFSDYIARYPRMRLMADTVDKCDIWIRQEQSETDFARFLKAVGLEMTHPMPRSQPKPGKKPFLDYYDEPAQRLARQVLGDVMAKWGYEFPDHFAH